MKNADEMISALIPTYRRPEKLRSAIQSVLNQTYANIQVYVLDNASGDGTAELVREFTRVDSRVHYICHEKNIGAFNNFQFGLKLVETPYFAFLSDDDVILPDFYETAIALLKRHPQAMFCATNVFRIGTHDCVMPMPLDQWRSGFHEPPEGFLSFVQHGHPEWTGTVFRSEVRSCVGLLDEATGKFSDLDYVLRISAAFPFCVTKKPCAVFDGSHGDSRTPYRFNMLKPCFEKMLKNIDDGDVLDDKVKQFAIQQYRESFESSLLRTGFLYLYRGYPTDVQQVIAELHATKQRCRAILLDVLMRGQIHIPGVAQLIGKMVRTRRWLHAKKVKNHAKLPMRCFDDLYIWRREGTLVVGSLDCMRRAKKT